MRSGCALAILAAAALLLAAHPAAARDEGETAQVVVGKRLVVTVREAAGGFSPAERASRASAALAELLPDPACGPEALRLDREGDARTIGLCGRLILEVTEFDAAGEGVGADALARAWLERLREAYASEKAAHLSRGLLESFLFFLIYPMGFLLAALLVRLASARAATSLERRPEGQGIRVGSLNLLASPRERAIVRSGLRLCEAAAHLLLAYLLVIALLRRFPGTAAWGAKLVEPLTDLAAGSLQGVFAALPRVAALLVLVVAVRALLGWISDLGRRVRSGRWRLGRFVTPDTATPAEAAARVVVVVVATFLGSLLVPGQAGNALLVVFVLAGIAFAAGARHAAENLVAGFVLVWGRPFRSGQRLRVGSHEGIVENKGFLHLTLRTDSGRRLVLPNREILSKPFEVSEGGRRIRMRVVLQPTRPGAEAAGLFRQAAAEAGLRREDGRSEIVQVEGARQVFDVRWSLPDGAVHHEALHAYLEALGDRAAGLGFTVIAAGEEPGLRP